MPHFGVVLDRVRVASVAYRLRRRDGLRIGRGAFRGRAGEQATMFCSLPVNALDFKAMADGDCSQRVKLLGARRFPGVQLTRMIRLRPRRSVDPPRTDARRSRPRKMRAGEQEARHDGVDLIFTAVSWHHCLAQSSSSMRASASTFRLGGPAIAVLLVIFVLFRRRSLTRLDRHQPLGRRTRRPRRHFGPLQRIREQLSITPIDSARTGVRASRGHDRSRLLSSRDEDVLDGTIR